MIRTQIYLTEKEKKSLKSLARLKGVNQSALIRKAIDDYILKEEKNKMEEIINKTSGIWAKRKNIPDVRELRTDQRRRTIV